MDTDKNDSDKLKKELEEARLRIEKLEMQGQEWKREKKSLLEKANRYEAIFETAPEGIITSDVLGNITECNNSFLKLTGFEREEIVGRHVSKLPTLRVADIPKYLKLIGDMVKGRSIKQPYEFIWRNKKGEERLGLAYYKLLKTGSRTELLAILHDATEERHNISRLKESETKFREFIEMLPEIVFEVNEKGELKFLNRAAFEKFGLKHDKEKLQYLSLIDVFHPDDRERILTSIKKNLSGERQSGNEYRLINNDGEVHYVQIFNSPMYRNGKIAGLRGIAIDISKRKRAEEETKRNEEKWRNLFEMGSDAIFLIDMETGKILEANRVASGLYGYSRAELMRMRNYDLSAEPEETIKATKQMKERIGVRYHKKKDGTSFPVEIHASHFEFQGRPVHIAAIRDISQRMRDTEELRFQSMILNQIQDMITATDLEGRITYVNEAECRILGRKKEQLLGMTVHDYGEDTERGAGQQEIIEETLNKGEWSGQVINYSKSDDEKILNTRTHLVRDDRGKPIGMVGISTDITETVRTQERLRESEVRFRNIFENSLSGLFYINREGRILEANPRILEILGSPSVEATKQINVFRFQPLVDAGYSDDFKQCLDKGETVYGETEYTSKWGKTVFVRYYFNPIKVEGQTVGVLANIDDITELIRTSKALMESETRYSSMFHDNYSVMLLIDPETGDIIDANRSACSYYGYGYEKLTSMNISQINEFGAEVASTEMKKAIEGTENHFFFVHRLSNNELRDVEVYSGNIKFGDKEYLYSIVHDITERNRMEQELTRIAKLESVGVLAGGIAHNFKNMLANISFNAGLARFKPDKAIKYLDKIDKAIEQASALATRFQTFSTGGEPVLEPTHVPEMIEDACGMALAGSGIELIYKFSEDTDAVEVDQKQINEVLTNLLINAKQAMPSGGSIAISCANSNRQALSLPIETKDKLVRISIADSGTGIPKKYLSKIFDPFFTTKAEGHGLGLASAHFIVKRHGGAIMVDSEPGVGTTFDIYLPASDKKSITGIIEEKEIVSGNGCRILYMDDDESLRENMVELGEMLEYEIETAANGEEAVARYSDTFGTADAYQAVILDLTIEGGGMQGEDVLNELRKIDPNVKAIVFSGHSTKPIVSKYKDYGFTGRLGKPISIDELSRVINDVCQ